MNAHAQRTTALVYQIVSRILDYPDERLIGDLPIVHAAVTQLPQPHRRHLTRLVQHLATSDPTVMASDYVATFDLRRRCCLYLTYYAYGDTRKRGIALLGFKHAYRSAGLQLIADELPDHLCVLLEFAATADFDAGHRLLVEHRAGLELLRLALIDAHSPYAGALSAVSATLPPLHGDDRAAVARLAAEGPPGEDVDLEPFAPPDYMGARA